MNIENLIHKIIELDEKINGDLKLISNLDDSGLDIKQVSILDEQAGHDLALLDSLKKALAEEIIRAYTGKDVREKKEPD